MGRRAWAAIALAATGAVAQEQPVDGEAFRRFSEGWTLHFEHDGRPFGAERYLPGDSVIWRPEGGDCAAGAWVEVDGAICFVYAGALSCWRLFRDARGLLARPVEGGPPELRVARRDTAALICEAVPAV